MQFTIATTLLTILATLSLAAPTSSAPVDKVQIESRQSLGRIQLEIDPDTFIQRDVNVPGTLNLNRDLITATIVSGPSSNFRCQAFNGNAPVGGPIVLNQDTILNSNRSKVFVSHVRCLVV